MRDERLLADLEAAGETLVAMRALGVKVLFHPDTHAMLFSPSWKSLPSDLCALIHEHKLSLVRLLVPWKSGQVIRYRPGWTSGALARCFSCDHQWPHPQSTAQRDPLGHPRHPECGWFRPDRVEVKSPVPPSYPKHLVSGS